MNGFFFLIPLSTLSLLLGCSFFLFIIEGALILCESISLVRAYVRWLLVVLAAGGVLLCVVIIVFALPQWLTYLSAAAAANKTKAVNNESNMLALQAQWIFIFALIMGIIHGFVLWSKLRPQAEDRFDEEFEEIDESKQTG